MVPLVVMLQVMMMGVDDGGCRDGGGGDGFGVDGGFGGCMGGYSCCGGSDGVGTCLCVGGGGAECGDGGHLRVSGGLDGLCDVLNWCGCINQHQHYHFQPQHHNHHHNHHYHHHHLRCLHFVANFTNFKFLWDTHFSFF